MMFRNLFNATPSPPSPPSPRPSPPQPPQIQINNPYFLNNAENWTLSGSSIASSYLDSPFVGANTLAIGPSAPTFSTVTQGLSPFIIGQNYSLLFNVTNLASGNCNLIVTIGSLTLLNTMNTMLPQWTLFNLTFTAISSYAALAFSAYNTPNYYYILNPTLQMLAGPLNPNPPYSAPSPLFNSPGVPLASSPPPYPPPSPNPCTCGTSRMSTSLSYSTKDLVSLLSCKEIYLARFI